MSGRKKKKSKGVSQFQRSRVLPSPQQQVLAPQAPTAGHPGAAPSSPFRTSHGGLPHKSECRCLSQSGEGEVRCSPISPVPPGLYPEARDQEDHRPFPPDTCSQPGARTGPRRGGLGPRTSPLGKLPPGAYLEGPQRYQRPHAGAGGQAQEDSLWTRAPHSSPCVHSALPPPRLGVHTWHEHRQITVERTPTGPWPAVTNRAERRWAGLQVSEPSPPEPWQQWHPPPPTGDSRRKTHPAPPRRRTLLCCNKHGARGGQGEPGKP